ncbi:MAG TPA: hypothetical protein VGI98_08605 [Candidatus Limnocylindrales bacterium]
MPSTPILPDGLADALGPAWPRLADLAQPTIVIPVWATVELDRAAASIATASRSTRVLDAPLLGARVRRIGLVPGVEPAEIVVAEPSTEGQLAAFLARHGEGWAAVYLVAPAAGVERLQSAGTVLTSPAEGPLGTERRVIDGPRGGPFVLVAEPR